MLINKKYNHKLENQEKKVSFASRLAFFENNKSKIPENRPAFNDPALANRSRKFGSVYVKGNKQEEIGAEEVKRDRTGSNYVPPKKVVDDEFLNKMNGMNLKMMMGPRHDNTPSSNANQPEKASDNIMQKPVRKVRKKTKPEFSL